MKLKKKLISFALSAAMVLTMSAVPMTAFAADTTTWPSPTQAMDVDNNIVKVGIHAAASTTSFFLGGNVVAERASDYSSITGKTTAEDKYQAAMEFTRLGAFGSSSNLSPDPYLWNYFYNLAVDAGHADGAKVPDEVYISAGAGSPMMSDTQVVESLGTSYTLARRPDVLMDTAGGYADLIAQLPENTDEDATNDYDPISLDYKAGNFQDLVNDMYNLSDAIKDSGKAGRYGDTEAIAEDYEAFMKGLQCYILKKIDEGAIQKKNVAVITNGADTDNDGVNDCYACVSNDDIIGTSTDRPAESIMYTTNNIKNVETLGNADITVESVGRNGQVTSTTTNETVATMAQLAQMDAIIFGGHVTGMADALRTEMIAAGINENDIPPIYDADPSDVFTIRANSVENFAGVGIFNGFLYPEVINPVTATMYIYDTFWHLDPSSLQAFAQANFANASLPAGITVDGSNYSKDEIQGMIDEGLQYYVDNDLDSTYGETTLAVVDKNILPEKTKTSITGATVKLAKSSYTYTGKALKPAATVTLDGTALKSGTDFTVKYSANTKVGTATATITGTGDYVGTLKATFKITKAANPMTAKAKKKTLTVKYSKLKKKNQTIAAKTAFSVSKAQGKVTYKKSSGNSKITVAKTGKITIKKGLKKKTYTVKVKASAAGNANYKAGSKTITLKIKVK